MKYSIAGSVTALAVPLIAAAGGALWVYSEFDDAPGGVLIGFLLIVGAMAFGLRGVWRGR